MFVSDISKLSIKVCECTKCPLHKSCNRTVFGSGNIYSNIVFIGEGPGKEEDELGIPFVGRSGKLLTKMVESIGLSRDRIYVMNVVKCRPPENRNPSQEEIDSCHQWFVEQLNIANPNYIVLLGKVACDKFTGKSFSMKQYRSKNPKTIEFSDGRKVTLIFTYHPAYLLRNPGMKTEAWKDMKILRDVLEERYE